MTTGTFNESFTAAGRILNPNVQLGPNKGPNAYNGQAYDGYGVGSEFGFIGGLLIQWQLLA